MSNRMDAATIFWIGSSWMSDAIVRRSSSSACTRWDSNFRRS